MPRVILGTEANPLYVVSRGEWKARLPKKITKFTNKPLSVGYEHHTVTAFFDAGQSGIDAWWKVVAMIFSGNETADALMRQIQNFHMDVRGWSDIAYNFLVDDYGVAYEGRGWDRAGGHTAGQNTVSHAICHIGNFTTQRASQPGLRTAAALWNEGIINGTVRNTFTLKGHRDAPGAITGCPGDALYAQLPALRLMVDVPVEPIEQEDDMVGILWHVAATGAIYFEYGGIITQVNNEADFWAIVNAFGDKVKAVDVAQAFMDDRLV